MQLRREDRMNSNNELTRDDIAIDNDFEIDAETGQEITAYVETWFDVDEKFGVDTSDDDVWLNMYATYNPYKDTIKVECVIDKPLDSESFDYEPTESEAQLLKDMITEKLKYCYGTTPKDFCQEAFDTFLDYGGPKL